MSRDSVASCITKGRFASWFYKLADGRDGVIRSVKAVQASAERDVTARAAGAFADGEFGEIHQMGELKIGTAQTARRLIGDELLLRR